MSVNGDNAGTKEMHGCIHEGQGEHWYGPPRGLSGERWGGRRVSKYEMNVSASCSDISKVLIQNLKKIQDFNYPSFLRKKGK